MPVKTVLRLSLFLILISLFSVPLSADESTPPEPLVYRQIHEMGGPYVYFDDIAISSDGKVYVADEWMDQISVFSPQGEVIDILKVNGDSRMLFPYAIAIDNSGTIYVGDISGSLHIFDNHHQYVKSIGGQNETNPQYQFDSIIGIAIGPNNKIFIASPQISVFDSNLNPIGLIEDVPLDGTSFLDVAVNDQGQIFVLTEDYGHSPEKTYVHIFDSDYSYLTTLGYGHDGDPNYELGNSSENIDIGPDGKIYVSDGVASIKVFNSDLSYFGTIGTGTFGVGENEFSEVSGVAFAPDGKIFVADTLNFRIPIYNHDLSFYGLFATDLEAKYQLGSPQGVTIGQNNEIYVADAYRSRVQIYDSQFSYLSTIGTTGGFGDGNDEFFVPTDVAVGLNNEVYIVDSRNSRIQIYDSEHSYTNTISSSDWIASDESYSEPMGVAVDSLGNIFITDIGENRVVVFNPDLSYKGELGIGAYGSGNDQFKNPLGIVIASNDEIWIADSTNHRIQIYSQDLNYSRTLGVSAVQGSDNQHFDRPSDLALSTDGMIYVSDSGNDRIQVFDASGNYLTTIPLPSKSLGAPNYAVAVDTFGKVFVADPLANRVFVFTPNTAPIAQTDTYNIIKNTTLSTNHTDGVLANDTDPELDPLTATVVNAPNHATTFNFNANGSFTYVPETDYVGQDSFTYQASDGLLFSSETTVTININAPTPTPTAEITPEPTAEVTPIVTAEPGSEPPSAPKNLRVDPRQGRPQITWSDDVQAEWFHIYIGSGNYAVHLLDAWIPREDYCADWQCSVIPLIDPTAGSYHVWMQAWGYGEYSTGGDSGFDGWSHAEFALPNTQPEAVTGMTVTSVGEKVAFGWNAPAGATWYNIWVGTGAPDWTPYAFTWLGADDLGCGAGGLCSWENSSLPDGEYVWYVKAWGPGGFSTGGMVDAPGWSKGPGFALTK